MKLQTTIPLKKSDNQIDYDSNVLLIGSCFAQNIGRKLDYFKFPIVQNPFGILFNPVAIENVIANAISGVDYTEDDIFEHQGLWHCFDAHSSISSDTKESTLNNLNAALGLMRKQLSKASHIVITLGTSWVYQLKQTDHIVANCHKIPQSEFDKRLLSVEEVIKCLMTIFKLIKHVNKNVAIIYTVSPVRHLKDGFVENTISKSHLITGLHQTLSFKNRPTGLSYFPSYELMIDELRDYRFYDRDMLHPNDLAIEYIWERFQQVFISQNSFPVMKEIDQIQKGLLHRPFNQNGEQHQLFLERLKQRIGTLQKTYPAIRFND